uniref:Plectin/eS10 N-terminal domain-containing protein n=1 Tax=Seriola dumerili TaxID=41447 RepID=A0A3B4U8Z0_SERDU
MVMPLADLRAIYERLFRDGVIVAKNDKRPQSMHPDVTAVSNLKVIRAMASLKSKGYVRETVAWKHAYYYLNNEGAAYLRDYLHLPQEILPAPLRHVRRPASSSVQVQTVKGPTSYITKPRAGRGKGEAGMGVSLSVCGSDNRPGHTLCVCDKAATQCL